MIPNEYLVNERHQELLREAEQRRLVRQIETPSLRQRAALNLLSWGAKLAAEEAGKCITVNVHEQAITVCPA